MKKTFLLITSLLISLSTFAQIYQNGNDKGVLWEWPDQDGSQATIIDHDSDGITITPNGSHAQYQPAGGIGIGETLDLSENPILYIKAKGTGSPYFRIDLTDGDGFDTSGAEVSTNLTEEFEVHILQFEGNFIDRWSVACGSGGSSTCPTDAENIVGMNFFINSTVGNYNGTVEIEWMSFGQSLEDLPDATDFELRYNQLGYTVDQPKFISIVGNGEFTGKSYTVYNSSNGVVLSGTTGDFNNWSDAGAYAYSVDLSAINTEGTYRFAIDEDEVIFKVLEDPYTELREEVFKYYYYNRASTEITSQYAGEFARAAGHPDDVVYVHKSAVTSSRPVNTVISAPKGWYDAGDYNKYIVNSGISTYTLLAAFEHYPQYFTDTTFNIPENGGNLPDILDEVKWNLDWMLAMQDEDGGVYHKLTGLGFSGQILPADYGLTRYVVKKTTSAALDFAAVMAAASRVFATYDTSYSAQMIAAAEEAYEWAQNNREEYYFQPNMSAPGEGDPLLDDVKTGEYRDSNFADEFQWAAVEMFITTGENTYATDFTASNINGGVPGWQNVATLALYSLANNESISSSIRDAATTNLIGIADNLKGKIDTSGMSIAMSGNDYVWGSNGVAGNQIMLLLNAYKVTENKEYLDAAYTALDYMFGRNGTNYSYLTGFGETNPTDPHHRISEAFNYGHAVPGMVVGGPHSSVEFPLSGECQLSDYPSGLEPAKTYYDGRCSYSTNEVTINWNAPMVYSLHALRAIQTGNDGTLSNADNYSEAFAKKFEVYPNPTVDTIYVKSLEAKKDGLIEVFTLKGEKIISKAYEGNEAAIDLANKTPGVYLMKITLGKEESFSTKIVKQ